MLHVKSHLLLLLFIERGKGNNPLVMGALAARCSVIEEARAEWGLDTFHPSAPEARRPVFWCRE